MQGLEGSNSLSGRGGSDTLEGGSARDVLDGGAGSDVMTGGEGGDIYTVDRLSDRVIEGASFGEDTIRFLTYTNTTENLALFSANIEVFDYSRLHSGMLIFIAPTLSFVARSLTTFSGFPEA